MYEAVCTMLIDMGVQNNPRFGTSSRKIRLVWEVLGQTVKIGDQEYPRQISKEFTNSLSDKSNLRKALQSWRGKSFTPQELKGFDLRKVLGAGYGRNRGRRFFTRLPLYFQFGRMFYYG